MNYSDLPICEYAKDPTVTAYHEAGHAVMAWLAHYSELELLPPNGDYLGKCTCSPKTIYLPVEALQAAAISIAGGVAQCRLSEPADFISEAYEELSIAAWNGCEDDMQAIYKYLPPLGEMGREALIEMLIPIVCDEIEKHWGRVHAVAQAYLSNANRLTEAQTEALLPYLPYPTVEAYRDRLLAVLEPSQKYPQNNSNLSQKHD